MSYESEKQKLVDAVTKIFSDTMGEIGVAWDTFEDRLGVIFSISSLVRYVSQYGGAALFASDLVDVFTDLFSAVRAAPGRAVLRFGILQMPLPPEWHQRAIALDDGVRMGASLFMSSALDVLTDRDDVLYRFVDSMAGRFRLLKFFRSMPDFDPVEGGNILRSRMAKAIILIIESAVILGGFVLLAAALINMALSANDRATASRATSLAFPQDAKRERVTEKYSKRINRRKGPDQ